MNPKFLLLIPGLVSIWSIIQWIEPTYSRQSNSVLCVSKKAPSPALTQAPSSPNTAIKKLPSSKGVPEKAGHQLNSNDDSEELQFLKPAPGLPKDSTLQVNLINPARGRLVCSYFSYRDPYPTSLVLCSINTKIGGFDRKPKDEASKGISFSTYSVKKSGAYSHQVLYGARFSPNGRYVLFKFGEPWSSASGYSLSVLDTQTNAVKLLPINLDYHIVSWSPDSDYIACIQGGDAQGGTSLLGSYTGPLTLYVCNWRTGQAHEVVSNDTVRGTFSWIAPHTLLYGALSAQGQAAVAKEWEHQAEGENAKPAHPKNKSQPHSAKVVPPLIPSQPDVYEFSPEDKAPKRLFHDGYLPVASPNGQWVAFFGSEHPDKPYPLRFGWQDNPSVSSLCIAHRDGTARKALDRVSGFYPLLYWLPDNHHLLTIEEVQSSPNVRIRIKKWDIETGRWQLAGMLQTQDYKMLHASGIDMHLQLLGISQDGIILYVSILEFTGLDPTNTFISGIVHLQAINLNSTTVKTIASIKDAGIDWHEEVASTPVTPSGL